MEPASVWCLFYLAPMRFGSKEISVRKKWCVCQQTETIRTTHTHKTKQTSVECWRRVESCRSASGDELGRTTKARFEVEPVRELWPARRTRRWTSAEHRASSEAPASWPATASSVRPPRSLRSTCSRASETFRSLHTVNTEFLQCLNSVGWVTGRASDL